MSLLFSCDKQMFKTYTFVLSSQAVDLTCLLTSARKDDRQGLQIDLQLDLLDLLRPLGQEVDR